MRSAPSSIKGAAGAPSRAGCFLLLTHVDLLSPPTLGGSVAPVPADRAKRDRSLWARQSVLRGVSYAGLPALLRGLPRAPLRRVRRPLPPPRRLIDRAGLS